MSTYLDKILSQSYNFRKGQQVIMSYIRPSYKKRRAELIIGMRDKGMSYNKISLLSEERLGGYITPQRINQIEKHYRERVQPEQVKETKEFLDSFSLDNTSEKE